MSLWLANHHPLRLHLFCFFFNDTATTEIYTLSLHDALPILRRQRAHFSPQPLGNKSHRSSPQRDRKSTRLNSSHGSISYAVFCLQKQQERQKAARKTDRKRLMPLKFENHRIKFRSSDEIQNDFFFNDTAPTEIYPLSLHDALPIFMSNARIAACIGLLLGLMVHPAIGAEMNARSEEHTSELQSHEHLVCRLLLEKNKRPQQHAGHAESRLLTALSS